MQEERLNLGQDIIEAVKRGGIERWQPSTRHIIPTALQASTTKRLKFTQSQMDKCFDSIEGQMTIAQISEKTGMIPETCYKYMVRLLEDGRVIRSQYKQPHLWFRK